LRGQRWCGGLHRGHELGDHRIQLGLPLFDGQRCAPQMLARHHEVPAAVEHAEPLRVAPVTVQRGTDDHVPPTRDAFLGVGVEPARNRATVCVAKLGVQVHPAVRILGCEHEPDPVVPGCGCYRLLERCPGGRVRCGCASTPVYPVRHLRGFAVTVLVPPHHPLRAFPKLGRDAVKRVHRLPRSPMPRQRRQTPPPWPNSLLCSHWPQPGQRRSENRCRWRISRR
jgi:hypothetical protein